MHNPFFFGIVHFMIEVNEELTRQVARLSHVSLSESEVSLFTGQLSQILQYMTQLSQVDVSSVQESSPRLCVSESAVETMLREDQVISFSPLVLDQERPVLKILESAPDLLEGAFKVPPIFSGE